MDKKKKIIVAIVTIVFIACLAAFIKFMLFPSKKTEEGVNKISIMTPGVDEHKIQRQSKIKNYDQQGQPDSGENQIIKALGELDKKEETLRTEERPIIEGSPMNPERSQKFPAQHHSGKGNIQGQPARNLSNEEEDINAELKELMELQNQLLSQQSAQPDPSAYSDADIDALLKYYEQHPSYGQPMIPGTMAPSGSTPEMVTAPGRESGNKLAGSVKQASGRQTYFQGAGSVDKTNDVLDLIPAETIDEGILVNGSMIAIRTKKEIRLKNPAVRIPKGAVVYGKINISTDRLLIDINSYRNNEKLYKLDFSLYDFDGREGIHLGNRTWPKIPSKVAKDVYEYAYQKGTQASAFGSTDNSVDLDEAKDIAVLSSAKHIGEEIFEKRRIYMPKKYHLWININTL